MSHNRRQILTGAAALGATALGFPAIAQGPTKIRVGYLNTLACDSQLWLTNHLGAWKRHGLDPEFRLFTTGLELFQAMVGGSIDMLTTGAVITSFPARGQGKMFCVNCIEYATCQLWVRGDQGINSFADLKGKRISTTTGTTAHVFLDNALRANGMDPAKDVEVVNQRMTEAVTSFLSGAVPAVALWIPFNVPVRDKLPGAKKLVDSSVYYPRNANLTGWAASNEFHANRREALQRVVRAWAEGNDFLVTKPDEAIEVLQKDAYKRVPLPELKEQALAMKLFSSTDWRKQIADGTVTRWLQPVTDFFVKFGNIQNPLPATKYFDTSIFLDTIKG